MIIVHLKGMVFVSNTNQSHPIDIKINPSKNRGPNKNLRDTAGTLRLICRLFLMKHIVDRG